MKHLSFSLSRCLYNRKVMVVVSVVLAVVIWYLVLSGPANIQERTLTVSATVDLTDSYAETIGLRLTDAVKTDVTVVVRGQWSVISRLSPSDLRVRANVSSVQKAGTQDVPLTVSYNSSSVDYDIISVSPNSVSISCDYWETEKFRVQFDSSTLTAAEGTQLGTPMLDREVTTDGTLEIAGPKTRLDRIHTVVARITEAAELSDVRRFDAQLVALEENGTEVPLDGCTVQGAPAQSVSVTVPVWVSREVPLSVALRNAPAQFDATRVTVTPTKLSLLGPANTLDTRTDLGEVGTLDFDTLSLDSDVREIELALPDAVQVVSGETAVTVRVDLSGFSQRNVTFTPSASNVSYTNNTTGKPASVQPRATTVCLIGKTESLAEISAADLRLTVDLTNASAGTAAYAARYRVVGYDDVWVYYGEAASGTSVYATLG